MRRGPAFCELSGKRPSLPTVIARLVRAIQWRDVHRAKGLFRHADAWLLDYPHEAGCDGGEGTGFQFGLRAPIPARDMRLRTDMAGPILPLMDKVGFELSLLSKFVLACQSPRSVRTR